MGLNTIILLSIGIFLVLLGGFNMWLHDRTRSFFLKILNYMDSISLATLISTILFYVMINNNGVTISKELDEKVWNLLLISAILLIPRILRTLRNSDPDLDLDL